MPLIHGVGAENILLRHPVEGGFTMPRLGRWAPDVGFGLDSPDQCTDTAVVLSPPEPPAPLQLGQKDNAGSTEQDRTGSCRQAAGV